MDYKKKVRLEKLILCSHKQECKMCVFCEEISQLIILTKAH